MTQDNYGEVINSQETYDSIAKLLLLRRNVLIGWTDGLMSHFDIVFAYRTLPPPAKNQIQGGIAWNRDLFVSIMRVGAFAFSVEDSNIHAGYYAEKLDRRGGMLQGITGQKLADLINGVRRSLLTQMQEKSEEMF